MQCPNCRDQALTMAERAGVEIDYCPKCRGVWLDRGELDKIIDRAATPEERSAGPNPSHSPMPMAHPQPYVPPPQQQQQYQQPPPQHYGRKPDDSHYGYPSPHGYPKKRKSWLSEIFD